MDEHNQSTGAYCMENSRCYRMYRPQTHANSESTHRPFSSHKTDGAAGDIGAFVVRNWLRAAPWEDPELYWRLSPISLVGNVTTPTMVMVGEEDWRTPTWEAEQFYGALKLRGIETALVRVPGSSHHIAGRPSRLIAKTGNILGWFEKFDAKSKDDPKPREQ